MREVRAMQGSARADPAGIRHSTGILPGSVAVQVWQQAVYALERHHLSTYTNSIVVIV